MLYVERLVVRTMLVQSCCFGRRTGRTLLSLYPASSVSQAFTALQAHGAQVPSHPVLQVVPSMWLQLCKSPWH